VKGVRWLVWVGVAFVAVGAVVGAVQAVATGNGSVEPLMLVGLSFLLLEVLHRMD
jgi:hypothetical protein